MVKFINKTIFFNINRENLVKNHKINLNNHLQEVLKMDKRMLGTQQKKKVKNLKAKEDFQILLCLWEHFQWH